MRLSILAMAFSGAVLAGPPPVQALGPAQSAKAPQPPAHLLQQVKWTDPAEPFHVAGPIYYVGPQGLGVWLFVTKDGDILFNTGLPGSGPMIADSIRKLGFDPKDIKILIEGHAHADHVGGHAYIKKLSGAKLEVMEGDVWAIEHGGKFTPVKVDRVLHDGDKITLGEVTLTALHTPGHTKGATTYVTTVEDGGKSYLVVFPDGGGINPGYRLIKQPTYPGIAGDYRETLKRLAGLKPDIWLAAHAEFFGLYEKEALAKTEGVEAWVDPDGYRSFIALQQRVFDEEIARETAP
jgi:metallo-beta-lactamase class B